MSELRLVSEVSFLRFSHHFVLLHKHVALCLQLLGITVKLIER